MEKSNIKEFKPKVRKKDQEQKSIIDIYNVE